MNRAVIGTLRLLPALIPLLVVVHSGRIGIELGLHWDEHLQLRMVARTVKSGVLVPGIYNYPTVSYWLTLTTVIPRLVKDWKPVPDLIWDINSMRSLEQDTTELQNYVQNDHPLFLRVRVVFLVVSSLAAIWVYLLVLRWRRHVGEAFVAAALLVWSWEFAYHARWIAPDLVMTSFAALSMMLVMLATAHERPWRMLVGATIAAGLATGTKYQCGLLLVPILMELVRACRRHRVTSHVIPSVGKLLAAFTATFVATTPAVVLDTGRVVRWILYVVNQYKSGDHGGYSVAAGFPHLGKILVYFGADYFSWHLPVAFGATAFMLLGLWAMVRESRWQAAVFLSVPVIYIVYMTTQRVFIVRNMLIVAPYLAVAAARGVRVAPRLVPTRLKPAATAVVVVLCTIGLGANAWWLYRSAESVARSTPSTAVRDFARYIHLHTPQTVFASNAVRSALKAQGYDLDRLVVRADQARELAFYPSEWPNPHSSNVWRASNVWFGPFELNWNRYTDWGGFQRIVLLTARARRSLNLKLDPLTDVPTVPVPAAKPTAK